MLNVDSFLTMVNYKVWKDDVFKATQCIVHHKELSWFPLEFPNGLNGAELLEFFLFSGAPFKEDMSLFAVPYDA